MGAAPAGMAPQTLEEPVVQIHRFKGILGRGYTAHNGRTWNVKLVGQSQPGMNRSSSLDCSHSFPTPNTVLKE